MIPSYHCRHPTTTVVILLPLSSSYYHCRHPTTNVVILLPLSSSYYHCRHPTTTVVILLPLSSSYYHCRHPTTIVVILLPLSYLAHSSIFETTMIECYKLEDSLQTRRFSTPSLRETISHTSGPGNPIPTPLPMQLPVTRCFLLASCAPQRAFLVGLSAQTSGQS